MCNELPSPHLSGPAGPVHSDEGGISSPHTDGTMDSPHVMPVGGCPEKLSVYEEIECNRASHLGSKTNHFDGLSLHWPKTPPPRPLNVNYVLFLTIVLLFFSYF